jgi:hypothetical protein
VSAGELVIGSGSRGVGEPMTALYLRSRTAAMEGQWLEQLYVDPDAQGRGIGRALLDTARKASPGGLLLHVFTRNVRARRFYEAAEFALTEQSDGRRNEEREPDCTYAWSAAARSTNSGIQPPGGRVSDRPPTATTPHASRSQWSCSSTVLSTLPATWCTPSRRQARFVVRPAPLGHRLVDLALQRGGSPRVPMTATRSSHPLDVASATVTTGRSSPMRSNVIRRSRTRRSGWETPSRSRFAGRVILTPEQGPRGPGLGTP